MNKPAAPSQDGAPVHITRVDAHHPVIALFVGPYRGLLLHWHAGRSLPCEGHDRCRQAIHSQRAIWRGYAPVEAWDASQGAWRPSVLEVTEQAEEQLRGRILRGEVWTFSRARMGVKRSPVVCQLLEQRGEDGLRPWWDVEPVLLRFFVVEQLLLDIPNLRPASVCLPAIPAAPPQLPPELQPVEPQRLSKAEAEQYREQLRRAGLLSRDKRKEDEHKGNGVV